MIIYEIYPLSMLGEEAKRCNAAADVLYGNLQQQLKAGVELEVFITTDGEEQPPQLAVALGALRQRAHQLNQQIVTV